MSQCQKLSVVFSALFLGLVVGDFANGQTTYSISGSSGVAV